MSRNSTPRAVLFVFAAACSGGAGGLVGDAGTDGAVQDATTSRDGASDAPPGLDAAVDTTCPPPTNPALCDTEADCTFVLRGCYCGAQPALGVNKASAAAVAACESEAAKNCALGCANQPGIQPDEGAIVDASAQVGVRCDTTTGGSPGTCFTFAK